MTSGYHPDYDPVAKRWKWTCPKCGTVIARAKRESAEWAAANHAIYAHDDNTEEAQP